MRGIQISKVKQVQKYTSIKIAEPIIKFNWGRVFALGRLRLRRSRLGRSECQYFRPDPLRGFDTVAQEVLSRTALHLREHSAAGIDIINQNHFGATVVLGLIHRAGSQRGYLDRLGISRDERCGPRTGTARALCPRLSTICDRGHPGG